ncbi:MAG: DUF4143 domain-containing protein [Spirochaetales bacterium]|nr:DUF4143 domain-containing protein [Spirochaetales bacterium]
MRNALAEPPIIDSLIKFDAGSLFEQFVMIELFYRCQYLGQAYKLSTWRTNTGAEAATFGGGCGFFFYCYKLIIMV